MAHCIDLKSTRAIRKLIDVHSLQAPETSKKPTELVATDTSVEEMRFVNKHREYLEDFSGGEMPAPERRLFLMSLSVIEVASLVEHYKQREVIEACDPLRYVPRH